MAAGPHDVAFAQQTVPVAGGGTYVFAGLVRLLSGTGNARAQVIWLQGSSVLLEHSQVLTLTAGYMPFATSSLIAPASSTAARVRVALQTEDSALAVCLDSLSFDGPPPPTATPTPPPPGATATQPAATGTPTLIPSLSPTLTTTPTRTPTATRTATPTRTPTVTRTPSPTATSTPSPAFESLLNGGFEDGLHAWSKVGGELTPVTAPVKAGGGAAALQSETTSTKWAYQVVRVRPGAVYEFSGHLWPTAGSAEAFLRISWYASSDGSGAALATADSPARLAGSASGYAFVATGAVVAPSEANSARLRVMLVPGSDGNGVLYIDEMTFGPAAAAPRPSATPAPNAAPEEEVAGVAITLTPFAEVSSIRTTATPSRSPTRTPTPRRTPTPTLLSAHLLAEQGHDNRSVPPTLTLVAVAVALIVTSGAGVYFYSRRRS